jgi:membrane protease YdiL (CAAX protease family)
MRKIATACKSGSIGGMVAIFIKEWSVTPAVWVYMGIWLTAALYYMAAGYGFPTAAAVFLVGSMLFCALTVAITKAPPDEQVSSPVLRRRLWLQTAAVLLFIGITGYTALAFHGLISERQAYVPVWSPLVEWFRALGYRWLSGNTLIGSPGLSISNPVRYFVLPLLVLLLLGARFDELGFRRGHRTGPVLLLWGSIPLAWWIFQLGTGLLTLFQLGRWLLNHALQNGFFEEFLFRGALQTRLARLISPSWALVIQAWVFGLWHLGLDIHTMNGDVLGGLALSILSHSVMGLAYGVIFYRTRNLVACSLLHIVLNSL